MASMLKAINDLIIDLVGTDYPDNIIYKNFYNDATLPSDNQFCVMRQFGSQNQLLIPVKIYDGVNEKLDFYQCQSTDFQVDFYGKPSYLSATKLQLALNSSYATTFLKAFGYTVFRCQDIINLTSNLDKGVYIDRYAIRFSLFSTPNFGIDQAGFNEAEFKLYQAGVIND